MAGWITSLWWKLKGWKVTGTFRNDIPKMVLAVGPHTSAWDIVVGIAARYIIPIKHAYFLGKKELFDGAFGWFFRAIGGTPVDRSSSHGLVKQVADKFNEHAVFRIAMSPEGTRKKVDKLRTGFYYIAKEANVPIQLVGFDFTKREVIMGPLIYPSADEANDFKQILTFFAGVEGKHKEMGMQHMLH
ncbi:acyltransferase [Lacibacter luteus]|uniref:Acyltransferase n=1 Tax=Lacibacter luteus TaxID=2508719 RepID=A0A4Q1CHE9_9BACT|nr:1-acyl-sn-glycerol-3-phosphate acyltransferase [Lacibacter luteus]RXK59680.1 acyltransferase [Lacibacter luteus]